MTDWHTPRMKPRVPGFLRERAVAAVLAGRPRREVAFAYGVCLRSLERWLALHAAGQSLEDKPRSGRPPLVGPEREADLRALVAERPTATLAELCDAWEERTGVRLGLSTMHDALERLGISRKK